VNIVQQLCFVNGISFRDITGVPVVEMPTYSKRKFLLGLVLSLIIVSMTLAIPGGAAANKIIQGRGTLWAKGHGLAILKGTGTVLVEGKGAGYVWVKGAETLTAQGEGRRFERHGWVLLVGWRGEVAAMGADMTVRIEGGLVEFTATGSGTAYLRGHGTYRIGHMIGVWVSVSVSYSP